MRAWAYLNIDNPMIAWLVYRGEVFSAMRDDHPSAISLFATRRLHSAANGSQMFSIEREIEERRLAAYPNHASRMAGFYAFESPEDAKRALKWGNFNPEHLSELEILDGSTVTVRDSEWITHDMGSGPGPWIDDYLGGRPRGTTPLTELTVEGAAAILNTPLRVRAGEVVDATWPDAHVPLEVGRIAFLLGFPVGRMTAAITANGDGGFNVEYHLYFPAEDPAFLEKLHEAVWEPDFPVNGEALRPIDEETYFRVPDMTRYNFRIS
jgi:hypothetical protein